MALQREIRHATVTLRGAMGMPLAITVVEVIRAQAVEKLNGAHGDAQGRGRAGVVRWCTR